MYVNIIVRWFFYYYYIIFEFGHWSFGNYIVYLIKHDTIRLWKNLNNKMTIQNHKEHRQSSRMLSDF